MPFTLKLVIYALLIRAVGVVASIVGVFAVQGKDDPNMDPMKPINVGFFVSTAIATLGFWLVSLFVFGEYKTFTGGGNGDFDRVIQNFWWLAALATTFGASANVRFAGELIAADHTPERGCVVRSGSRRRLPRA